VHRDDVLALKEMWYDLVSWKCERIERSSFLSISYRILSLARSSARVRARALYHSLTRSINHAGARARTHTHTHTHIHTHRQQALKSTQEPFAKFRSPHPTVCVLVLLYMCPHTTIYVSSGLNRNARHAIGLYECAAIHTCGPFLSTLLLQGPLLHKDEKAKIQKCSLTHSPPQRRACVLPLRKMTRFSKRYPPILHCHTQTQRNTKKP